MRLIKILAAGAAGIIGVVAVGLLALWLWVNPSDYQAEIANAVQETTGRELIFQGGLKLSVFPWVAFALGPASLSNPAGFAGEPFLTFRSAAVRVRFWPLLTRRLVIDRVDVDGLDLRLRRGADGVGNWEGFGFGRATTAALPAAAGGISQGSSAAGPSSQGSNAVGPSSQVSSAQGSNDQGLNAQGSNAVGSSSEASSAVGSSSQGSTVQGSNAQGYSSRGSMRALAGIRVTNGRVSFQNLVIEKLRLETGAFGEGGVTPVTLSFDANRGKANESASLIAKFGVSTDLPHQELRLQGFNGSGLVSLPGDGHPSHWELSVPSMAVNLIAQTLQVDEFAASILGAHVTGQVQGSKLIDDAVLTGTATLAPLVVREFAPRLGLTLPRTADPRALAELSASGRFRYDANGLQLSDLQAQLDDTHVKGQVAVTRESRVVFELTVDRVNLDRYLNPDAASAPASAPAPASLSVAAQVAAKPAMGEAPVPAPVEVEVAAKPAMSEAPVPAPVAVTAKPVTGEAPLSPPLASAAMAAMGEAPSAEASRPDVDGKLTVGSLHVSPLDFQNLRLTLTAKDRVLHVFPALAQIDGGSYSGDVTLDRSGAMPVLSIDEHLRDIDVGRLLAATSSKGRMSGRGTVNLKATARGTGMPSMMRTLDGHFDANLAGGALEGLDLDYELGRARAFIHHDPDPMKSNPPRTKFDEFRLSAQITNGVAVTKDLSIASPMLRVTGRGSTNLVNKGIDLNLLASLMESPGASIADVPLKLTGTFANPTVRPDLDAFAKGQMKQKLEDLLEKNGLKGLFGK